MPLVMLCGHPCSGKSARATELISYISTHAPTTVIHLINEEVSWIVSSSSESDFHLSCLIQSLGIVRDEAYKNSITERQARGELKSAVERLLSQEHLVICDSLNYIKGFRYELFCRARTVGTTSCVVRKLFELAFFLSSYLLTQIYCNTCEESCRSSNAGREVGQYSEAWFAIW